MTQDAPIPQQRLSKLAILSLLLSLLVCVPGLGVFGMALGSMAVFVVGQSGGRLAGRTAAIAAIVIGALGSAVWVSVGVGLRKTFEQHHAVVAVPTLEFLQDLDKGNLESARKQLSPGASITDEQLASFASRTRATLGEAIATPTPAESLGAFLHIRRALADAKADETCSGGPIRFAGGVAIVILRPAASGVPAPANSWGSIRPFPSGTVVDVTIVTAGGDRISLNDPTNRPRPTP